MRKKLLRTCVLLVMSLTVVGAPCQAGKYADIMTWVTQDQQYRPLACALRARSREEVADCYIVVPGYSERVTTPVETGYSYGPGGRTTHYKYETTTIERGATRYAKWGVRPDAAICKRCGQQDGWAFSRDARPTGPRGQERLPWFSSPCHAWDCRLPDSERPTPEMQRLWYALGRRAMDSVDRDPGWSQLLSALWAAADALDAEEAGMGPTPSAPERGCVPCSLM